MTTQRRGGASGRSATRKQTPTRSETPRRAPRGRAAGAPAETIAVGPFVEAGPVLLAVDDSPASQRAAQVALELAEQKGAHVHVLSVVDTRPAPIPPPVDLALALADGAYGATLHAQQKRDIRAGLSKVVGRSVDWPVDVKLGTPAHAIAAEARRLGSSLVVLGLRRHHAVDRALHDETTLEVMRAGVCPVLGVASTLDTLPRRVVVGVDFSRASLTAARIARSLLADGGTLVLAYVAPPWVDNLPDDGERTIRELGVAAAFKWFAGELGPMPGIALENALLQHEPGRTVCELLIAHASGTHADLIALGSLRHGRIERFVLGSVTSDVARDGRHSLLAVPPAETDGR
ncbi:MAG TPA: universal stress protein [Gemmatimonadaceae bacterium]|nr:universal stress protein [Gemmatimonadaceae bacterium]